MSTALLDRLRENEGACNWEGVLARKDEIMAMTGLAAEQAEILHILGRAHWNLARDAWDLTLGIKYARAASMLDDLQGKVLWALGIRLVTIGRFVEGRRILTEWLVRRPEWKGATERQVADVQYTLGYAARYEGNFQEAELWYTAARASFESVGQADWTFLTDCALVQVLARQGRSDEAMTALKTIPQGGAYEAYWQKAQVEVLAASGANELALKAGELASETLLDLDDSDPWELAELHLLLADLQFRAGNLVEKEKHLALAVDVLRTSPRHDLYKIACTLLDYDYPGKEVVA